VTAVDPIDRRRPQPRWWRTRRGWVTAVVSAVGTYGFLQVANHLHLFEA
jgi:hypothetical protein